MLCGECLLRGIEIPSPESLREAALFEMIRHARHIEADRWEFGLKIALALLGDKEPKEASKIARLLRNELMASLNHITPTLDYAMARAKAVKAMSDKEKQSTVDARMVASWGKE